jgi:hypothetical protein
MEGLLAVDNAASATLHRWLLAPMIQEVDVGCRGVVSGGLTCVFGRSTLCYD